MYIGTEEFKGSYVMMGFQCLEKKRGMEGGGGGEGEGGGRYS